MGHSKKSRQSSDFAKPNKKPGKKIQKTNVTNTTFKAKPLVILKQLSEKDPDAIVTQTGLTLPDILEKLNHFSEPIMLQALDKLLVLFVKKPEVAYSSLNKIISSVGKIIGWDGISNDNLKNKLSKVLYRICIVPPNILMPHFNHFCTYIMTGLSNSRASMKLLALKAIGQLCNTQKEAAVKCQELFKAFCRFISCDCVKGKLTKEVVTLAYKTTQQFISLYVTKMGGMHDKGIVSYEIHNDSFTVVDEPPTRMDPFEFKVCGFGNQASTPVSSIEGVCTLVDAIFVFYGKVLSLENFEVANDLQAMHGTMRCLLSILTDHLRRIVVPPGVYGPFLLELADKNKFMDGIQKRKDKKLAEVLQKISVL